MQVFTRGRVALAVARVAVGLLVAPSLGCGGAKPDTDGTAGTPARSRPLASAPLASACVAPGMDVALPRVDAADTLQLGALRGRVVLIEFMASWCGECLEALPHLAALHRDRGADGLSVLWVSQDFDRDDIETCYEQHRAQIPFAVVHDAGERWWASTGFTSVPGLVVIDRAGCVRMAEAAEGDAWRRADALVERLLAAPGT